MSGHSKWSQIKHKKALSDMQRSKQFGKLAREITVASLQLGSNPEINPKLKAAIEKARSLNMPSENIERAIKKASAKEESAFEEVMFEAYGPGGAALIITGITNNKNRATQEIKHILSEHQAKLASPGSAKFLFQKTGSGWKPKANITIGEKSKETLSKLFESLDENDNVNDIYTNIIL